MNRRQPNRLLKEEVGLQIAPMIDVTMLLLFFFMLSTTLERRSSSEKIELPIANTEQELTPIESPFVIVLTGSGGIVLNGTSTSLEGIGAAISSDLRGAGIRKRIVEINAGSATPGATIKRLVTAITQAGAQEISYVIQTE